MKPEKLFAFSGIDGAGKTTLINSVTSELRISGHDVFISKAYTQEHKEALRPFIETADDTEMMFLFQAMHRRQRNEALARLALGSIVLADRWSESYDAYHSQNGVLSIHDNLRDGINELAFEGLKPFSTFYLRTRADVAMRRTHERGADFFDAKSIAYHRKQAHFYDRRGAEDPTWVILDGHDSPHELVAKTLETINSSLEYIDQVDPAQLS